MQFGALNMVVFGPDAVGVLGSRFQLYLRPRGYRKTKLVQNSFSLRPQNHVILNPQTTKIRNPQKCVLANPQIHGCLIRKKPVPLIRKFRERIGPYPRGPVIRKSGGP